MFIIMQLEDSFVSVSTLIKHAFLLSFPHELLMSLITIYITHCGRYGLLYYWLNVVYNNQREHDLVPMLIYACIVVI